MHERVGERTVERLPPEYAAWAARAGRETARAAKTRETSGSPSIAWPRDGDRLLLDPGRPRRLQAIEVRALAPPGADRVTLRVDGKIASTLGPPFVGSWVPEEGEHVLVAEAPGFAAGEPVRVRVE